MSTEKQRRARDLNWGKFVLTGALGSLRQAVRNYARWESYPDQSLVRQLQEICDDLKQPDPAVQHRPE